MRRLKALAALLMVVAGTASGSLAGTYNPGDFSSAPVTDGGTDPTNVKP